MKTLAVSLLVLLFCSFSLHSQETFKLGFTGAYPNAYNYPVFSTIDWGYYDELKMNTWQGWWIGENWHSSASSEVLQKLDDENIDGFFQPDTIRWAGYGRVQVINSANTTERFRFDGRWCGTPVTDNGKTVMYYDKNGNCPDQSLGGLILYDVDENGFQSFSGVPYDPVYQVPFPYNDYLNPNYPVAPSVNYLNIYYIKPRMRISTTDAFGTVKNVVKIITKKFNGEAGPEITITTEDFRYTNSSTYDGRYLEDYFIHNLSVFGDVINAVGETGGRPGNDPAYLNDCQVDYQVYWYGEVSVWIDYVKVMDEAAYRLFNPDPAFNLDDILQEKIDHLKNNDTEGRMKGFYMEEIDYSNLTCLKYLNENLPVWADNPDYKMIALINPGSYQAHLHTNEFSSYEEYIDMVQPPAFMTVRYNAIGDVTGNIPLPVNAGITVSSSYPSGVKSEIEDIYGAGIEKDDAWYTAWLEDTSLAQVSSDMFHLGDLCKQKNIPFYFVPHYWQNGIIWQRACLFTVRAEE